ncbi:hypothetical protein M2333_000255 [Sphingobium sp. B11D3B]|uniref:hypothetical protein n=1 Tax=Sphingobium sp. B11D3B TaxID=2940575 RepID=UPI002227360E|nr:hypothetical protein [Sphingobium sp. B11D3B]MCW2387209.1 hypothetical protein [Sphingobium sp. B11D3B]
MLAKVMTDRGLTAKVARPTPQMRALFREIARDIIADDRKARKYGLAQNAIGRIERAMVKAYVAGQQALLDDSMALPPVPDAAIEWLELPPRARNTLISMTGALSGLVARLFPDRPIPHAKAPDEIELTIENGRKRWTLVRDDKRDAESIADGSVAPLIRLGLLAPRPDSDGRYALTDSGLAAAREYWRRADAGDPTLPRESMR